MNIALKKLNMMNVAVAIFLVLTPFSEAYANEVKILAADFRKVSGNNWAVSVTLKHGDTGWDHYADNWRVVDSEGNVLGDRVLYHPHEDEQPFTRGLSSVSMRKVSRSFTSRPMISSMAGQKIG